MNRNRNHESREEQEGGEVRLGAGMLHAVRGFGTLGWIGRLSRKPDRVGISVAGRDERPRSSASGWNCRWGMAKEDG